MIIIALITAIEGNKRYLGYPNIFVNEDIKIKIKLNNNKKKI